jgi:cytidine deaminase
MTEIDWKSLIGAASRVRLAAHAPYSGYKVGAAIVGASGRVFEGCNVENASFGLTVCAERNAVAQLVASGERSIVAVAVVTAGPEPGAPCGLCRQALAEFADDVPIALAVAGDETPRTITSLADLLPHPFRGDLLRH